MTNEITSITDTAKAVLTQMQQWPVAILLVAVLIVLGGAIKVIPFIPNRYIPLFVLMFGSIGNGILGDPGSVAPTQRHPEAVLAMQGFLLGFAAWGLHHFLLRKFEKYIPLLAGKSGDTKMFEKEIE